MIGLYSNRDRLAGVVDVFRKPPFHVPASRVHVLRIPCFAARHRWQTVGEGAVIRPRLSRLCQSIMPSQQFHVGRSFVGAQFVVASEHFRFLAVCEVFCATTDSDGVDSDITSPRQTNDNQ